jgi:hypothetical protein
MSQCLLCLVSSVFNWLVGRLYFVLRSEFEAPFLPHRSLTNVSLICQCDNFDLQEARLIKLLRVVRSRRWKKNSICPFAGPSANRIGVRHVVRFVSYAMLV